MARSKGLEGLDEELKSLSGTNDDLIDRFQIYRDNNSGEILSNPIEWEFMTPTTAAASAIQSADEDTKSALRWVLNNPGSYQHYFKGASELGIDLRSLGLVSRDPRGSNIPVPSEAAFGRLWHTLNIDSVVQGNQSDKVFRAKQEEARFKDLMGDIHGHADSDIMSEFTVGSKKNQIPVTTALRQIATGFLNRNMYQSQKDYEIDLDRTERTLTAKLPQALKESANYFFLRGENDSPFSYTHALDSIGLGNFDQRTYDIQFGESHPLGSSLTRIGEIFNAIRTGGKDWHDMHTGLQSWMQPASNYMLGNVLEGLQRQGAEHRLPELMEALDLGYLGSDDVRLNIGEKENSLDAGTLNAIPVGHIQRAALSIGIDLSETLGVMAADEIADSYYDIKNPKSNERTFDFVTQRPSRETDAERFVRESNARLFSELNAYDRERDIVNAEIVERMEETRRNNISRVRNGVPVIKATSWSNSIFIPSEQRGIPLSTETTNSIGGRVELHKRRRFTQDLNKNISVSDFEIPQNVSGAEALAPQDLPTVEDYSLSEAIQARREFDRSIEQEYLESAGGTAAPVAPTYTLIKPTSHDKLLRQLRKSKEITPDASQTTLGIQALNKRRVLATELPTGAQSGSSFVPLSSAINQNFVREGDEELMISSSEQGTASWHGDRLARANASYVSNLHPGGKYANFKQMRRVDEFEKQSGKTVEDAYNPTTDAGHIAEPILREMFEKQMGMKVLEVGQIRNPKYDALAASVDGMVGKNSLFEAKFLTGENRRFENITDKHRFFIQAQAQMAVTNRDKVYLTQGRMVRLPSGKMGMETKIDPIERDQAFIDHWSPIWQEEGRKLRIARSGGEGLSEEDQKTVDNYGGFDEWRKHNVPMTPKEEAIYRREQAAISARSDLKLENAKAQRELDTDTFEDRLMERAKSGKASPALMASLTKDQMKEAMVEADEEIKNKNSTSARMTRIFEDEILPRLATMGSGIGGGLMAASRGDYLGAIGSAVSGIPIVGGLASSVITAVQNQLGKATDLADVIGTARELGVSYNTLNTFQQKGMALGLTREQSTRAFSITNSAAAGMLTGNMDEAAQMVIETRGALTLADIQAYGSSNPEKLVEILKSRLTARGITSPQAQADIARRAGIPDFLRKGDGSDTMSENFKRAETENRLTGTEEEVAFSTIGQANQTIGIAQLSPMVALTKNGDIASVMNGISAAVNATEAAFSAVAESAGKLASAIEEIVHKINGTTPEKEVGAPATVGDVIASGATSVIEGGKNLLNTPIDQLWSKGTSFVKERVNKAVKDPKGMAKEVYEMSPVGKVASAATWVKNRFSDKKSLSQSDLETLALNIYNEARSDGDEGQLAVGEVTLNRVDSLAYPNSIKDVVYQEAQFSWTLKPTTAKSPAEARKRDKVAWERAMKNAQAVADGVRVLPEGTKNFHASSMVEFPPWTKGATGYEVGQHIFYQDIAPPAMKKAKTNSATANSATGKPEPIPVQVSVSIANNATTVEASVPSTGATATAVAPRKK